MLELLLLLQLLLESSLHPSLTLTTVGCQTDRNITFGSKRMKWGALPLAGFPSISSREAGLGQLPVKVVIPSPITHHQGMQTVKQDKKQPNSANDINWISPLSVSNSHEMM